MKRKSEVERQSKALGEFTASISRPVIHWPYRHTREAKAHKRWRVLASAVRRFKLYAAAELELLPGMTKVFFDTEDMERAAHRKMLEEKHRREMRYCTGKDKTPPPWDF